MMPFYAKGWCFNYNHNEAAALASAASPFWVVSLPLRNAFCRAMYCANLFAFSHSVDVILIRCVGRWKPVEAKQKGPCCCCCFEGILGTTAF